MIMEIKLLMQGKQMSKDIDVTDKVFKPNGFPGIYITCVCNNFMYLQYSHPYRECPKCKKRYRFEYKDKIIVWEIQT